MDTTAESTGDVNMGVRTESTGDVKLDTIESINDVKTGSTTENTGDVSCIEQSRIMNKNKKRQKNKAIENVELPSKKKKYRN